MNNDEIRDALNPGEEVRMRPHEMEAGKVLLREYVRAHPAQAPWYIRAQDGFANGMPRMNVTFAQPAFAVVMMVLFVGAGTSYAAENALPGEILYPVKKVVNEGVRAALAVSPAAQVEWQTERVNRRLDEVQRLASRDTLTPDITRSIEREVSDAADEIESHATSVIALNDTVAAPKIAEAEDHLRGSIEEHVQRLDTSVSSERSTTTREEVASIVAHVRGRFRTGEGGGIATAATLSARIADDSRGRDDEGRARGKRGATAPALMSITAPDDDSARGRGVSATMMMMATTSTTSPTIIPAIDRSGRHGDDDDEEFED